MGSAASTRGKQERGEKKKVGEGERQRNRRKDSGAEAGGVKDNHHRDKKAAPSALNKGHNNPDASGSNDNREAGEEGPIP